MQPDGPFRVIPFRKPSLAECQEFMAGDGPPGPAYPHSLPPQAIKARFPDSLWPTYVPEGLRLVESRLDEDRLYLLYKGGGDPHDPGPRMWIDQGPLTRTPVRIEAPEGLYKPVAVNGHPAYVIRGSATIMTRYEGETPRVIGCEWDEDADTKVLLVRDGYFVSVIGVPASEFPEEELLRVAESLEDSGARNRRKP